MALRLLQIMLPDDAESDPATLLGEHEVVASWRDETVEPGVALFVVVDAQKAEPVMDALEQRFGGLEGFHAVLLPVEAVLPRPRELSHGEIGADGGGKGANAWVGTRVSREELYAEVTEGVSLGRIYIALTVLSTIVAALGLMRGNSAIVIAAMVIAPLLGPNIALAFATTIGDYPLLWRAMRTNLVGVSLALGFSIVIGMILTIDPTVAEIASRTEVGIGDIVLALAAGIAGVLAITTGQATTVLGVMVAVALMPPAVVVGLLVGSGRFDLAAGAALLLVANVVCVNLAGVATFVVQGVRPRTWYEAERAKKASWRAVLLWTVVLAVLIVVVVWSR